MTSPPSVGVATGPESVRLALTVDLKPGGREIQVTNENKKEYVE